MTNIRKLNKKRRRAIFLAGGSLLIFFLFGTMATIPLFNKKNEVEVGTDSLVPLGDEDNPAYDYWYAPEHSFGISSMKTVNWTHFKNLFKNNFQYNLEYRIGGGDWVEAKEYLTVSADWQGNDSGFWKINLTFTKPPSPMMDVRFTIGMNKQVIDYVERAGQYEYWINYTANQSGEVYNCFFNWSDLMGIPNLIFNHGVQDNLFWFRFRKDDVPQNTEEKVYVFDPTFGHTGTESNSGIVSYENSGSGYEFIRALKATAGADGTADNITVYIECETGSEEAKCALYDSDGDKLGETEEKTISTSGYYWETFDFASGPAITNGNDYYICLYGDCPTPTSGYKRYIDSARFSYTVHTNTYYNMDNNYPTYDASVAFTLSGKDMAIYCSFSEGGGETPASPDTPPVIENGTIANASTNIGLDDGFEIDVYDSQGDQTTWCNCSEGSTDKIIGNGTLNVTMNLTYNTLYWCNTTSVDCCNSTENNTYFTTEVYVPEVPDTPVYFDNEDPVNNSIDQELSFIWSCDVTDDEGDISDWWVQCLGREFMDSGNSNSTALLDFSGLEYSTEYTVECFGNDSNNYTYEMFKFTTMDEPVSWNQIAEWNLTISNSSSWNQLIEWNITLSNTGSWSTINTWNLTLSNTSSFQQIQEWNLTISNLSNIWNQIIEWNLTISNSSSYSTIKTWNLTLSNTSSWNQLAEWNITISNTSVFQQLQEWNITISNTTDWNTISTWNITLSNTSISSQLSEWNITLSNTSAFQQFQEWNITISNTSSFNLINTWNLTISNTSAFQEITNWNLTISNLSNLFKEINNWNITISNRSNVWYQQLEWNITISNATADSWQQIIEWNLTISNTTNWNLESTWNLTLSNSTPLGTIRITNIYPGNNSYNIPLQPYLYATFNSTQGNNLNITWRYNSTSLGLEGNVTNGTYNELLIFATDFGNSYTWEVQVNDGEGNYLNTSYNFITETNIKIISGNQSVLGIVGVIGLIGFIFFLLMNRRKKKYGNG